MRKLPVPLRVAAVAAAILASTAAASDCQPRAAGQGAARKVLMPAHSCTSVKFRGGDVRTVCDPQLDEKHPRRYPPYPVVAHGRRDRVQHSRYPAEWANDGDQADADAAREAAASGAWR